MVQKFGLYVFMIVKEKAADFNFRFANGLGESVRTGKVENDPQTNWIANGCLEYVILPSVGLEPTRITARAPKARMSTNFITRAAIVLYFSTVDHTNKGWDCQVYFPVKCG